MNTSGQNQPGKNRLSLSVNSSTKRQSLVPAKIPRGIGNGKLSNLLGEMSTLPNQNDSSQTNSRSQNSFDLNGKPSLASRRLSVAGNISQPASTGNSSSGRLSINARASLSSLESRNSIGRVSSGAPGHRNAISMPSNLRDPRPIRDKEYIFASIKLIVEFLAKTGYDKPISQKILTTPMAKDFQYIFRYLYLQLDPSCEFGKNFEQEVLFYIKCVHYPFANDISKSSLASLATLHTWPVLLAMLHWIVEVIVCYQNFTYESIENTPEASLFYFLLKNYQSYIDGNEDINEMKTELISRFEQAHIPICKEIERIKKQVTEIQQATGALEKGDVSLPVMKKEKHELEADLDRYKKFLKMLEAKRDKHLESLQQERETQITISEEINAHEEEKKLLQVQVDAQQICSEDVERINSDKEMRLKSIDSLNQQKEEANKLSWEKEMLFQKRFDSIEKLHQDFNNRGRLIKVIPEDSEYANGINFELSFLTPTAKSELAIVPSIKDHIQPSLLQLRDHLNDSVHTAQGSLISFTDQLDSIKDAISEGQEEFKNLNERIKVVNQQYVEEKEIFNAETKKSSEEMQNLETELMKIKAETSNAVVTSQQNLQKIIVDSDNAQKKIKEETEILSHEICAMLDELLTFKGYVEGNLNDLKDLAEKELSEQLGKQ